MRKQQENSLKSIKMDPPGGMTISVGEAAQLLNTSRSTLKRHAAEWGLRTFWDGRGRRYSFQELKEVRDGTPEPQEPPAMTRELDAITQYDLPGGYRFRVYRTDSEKSYVGFFAFEEYDHIESELSYALGAGTYYLKLLDENNRMTPYTFVVHLLDPDEERQEELAELRSIKQMTRHYINMTEAMKGTTDDN